MLRALSMEWTQKFENMGDKLFLSTTMMIVGITIVFFALVFLIFYIQIFSKLIEGLSGLSKAARQKKIEAKLAAADSSLSSGQNTVNPSNTNKADTDLDEEEIVAVIGAVLAAYKAGLTNSANSANLGSGRPAPYPGFKVKSIKRIR